MNNKQTVTRTTIIFTGLALAGMAVAISSQVVSSDFTQILLVAIGSAIFGSGLTFFLFNISNLEK